MNFKCFYECVFVEFVCVLTSPPHSAMGRYVICNCDIYWSYTLGILHSNERILTGR